MLQLEIVFWTSMALLAYAYAGYPLLICAWAWLRSAPFRAGSEEPTISLLLVAHNESARIERRIANLLALDYSRDHLEILIGSDGSTDDTVTRARRMRKEGIRVFDFPVRRGKPAVLDDLAARARGDLLVLADARQRFDAGTLRALVRPFADPTVGAVSGELVLGGGGGAPAGQGVGLYWRIEKLIRSRESRVDSTVGATGAVYAVRRDLFEPIPHDTILDDVLVPMRIVAKGYRVVFEPGARAYDRAAASGREELTRKVRTIAGNFQLFAREPWLLDPLRNRLWFQTLSHKALRLAGPLLLLGAFASCALALDRPLYRLLFVGQILFYAAALSAHLAPSASRRIRPLAVPYVVCLLNWATVVAFFRFVAGRQQVTWEKSPAGSGTGPPRGATVAAGAARSRRSA